MDSTSCVKTSNFITFLRKATHLAVYCICEMASAFRAFLNSPTGPVRLPGCVPNPKLGGREGGRVKECNEGRSHLRERRGGNDERSRTFSLCPTHTTEFVLSA